MSEVAHFSRPAVRHNAQLGTRFGPSKEKRKARRVNGDRFRHAPGANPEDLHDRALFKLFVFNAI
jgi:hypothetical protein